MKTSAIAGLKLFQTLFKLYLLLGLILMCLHCLLLLLGFQLHIAEYVISLGLFPFVALYICTFALSLCRVSRIVLCYNYLISCCIFWQKNYALFGDYVNHARAATTAIGIVLIIMMLRRCRNPKQEQPLAR